MSSTDVNRKIEAAFKALLDIEEAERTKESWQPKVSPVPWYPKVISWLDHQMLGFAQQDDHVATPNSPSVSDAPSDDVSISECDTSESGEYSREFHQYLKTIEESAAYTWLLGTLQREAVLQPTGSDLMEGIRTEILRSFSNNTNSTKISRRKFPTPHKATFILHWCPWTFLEDRESHESPEDALLGSITFTGSPSDAQAAMFPEYIYQTWPSTGKDTIQLLRNLMRSTHGTQCHGKSQFSTNPNSYT